MSWMFSVFAGFALLGLVAAFIVWLVLYMEGRQQQMKQAATPAHEQLLARMDEVEARLRDVLDVMIAVSEKMDRWERDQATAPRDLSAS